MYENVLSIVSSNLTMSLSSLQKVLKSISRLKFLKISVLHKILIEKEKDIIFPLNICISSQLYSFFISYIFQFVQLSALSFINVSARILS